MVEYLEGTKYELKKIDPFNFSDKDALDLALLHCRTFNRDTLLIWWHGPKYDYDKTPIRLEKRGLFSSYNAHELLVKAWQRSYQLELLIHGMEHYNVYDGDAIVGLIQWLQPPAMRNPRSFFERLHAWIRTKYIQFKDWWTFLGSGLEHPLNNPRIDEFGDYGDGLMIEKYGKWDTKALAASSPEKLASVDVPYIQKDYYLYLSFLGVSPDYQRQGIAYKLFKQTLSKQPKTDIPIVDNETGNSVIAPQKVNIRSSDVGALLYKKLGCAEILQFFNDDGVEGIVFDQVRSAFGY